MFKSARKLNVVIVGSAAFQQAALIGFNLRDFIKAAEIRIDSSHPIYLRNGDVQTISFVRTLRDKEKEEELFCPIRYLC